jgi:hypothetical protein
MSSCGALSIASVLDVFRAIAEGGIATREFGWDRCPAQQTKETEAMRQQTAQRMAVGLDSMTKNGAMPVPAVYTILDGDRRVLSVTVPWGDDPVDLSTPAGERRAIYDALIFWFSCIGEEEVHDIFGDELAYRLWPLTPDGGKPLTSLDPSLDYRAASALEVRILCHEFEREIGDDYDEVPSWITYHMDDAARRGGTTV